MRDSAEGPVDDFTEGGGTTAPPLHEPELRRAGFQAGRCVRLGDGAEWWLPRVEAVGHGLGPLLEALRGTEDRSEWVRGLVALGIHLLDSNYALTPVEFERLLTFEHNAASRAAWMGALEAWADEALARKAPRQPARQRFWSRWFRS